MLATATEHSAKGGVPCATPRDAGEQRQRSFVAVGGSRDVRRLTTELRCHERKHAIVVLSLAEGSQQSVFPFGGIWTELAQSVPICLLSTSYICRRFAEAVGSGLACRDGAARIYWPQVTAASDPNAHPLVLPQVDGDSRTPLERFVSAFELSRQSVRRHLAPIERRLHELEQQATQQEQALVKGRIANDEGVARADAAESELRAAQQTLDALRSAERLAQLGFIEQLPNRKYTLGMVSSDIGRSVLDIIGLPRVAQPFLKDLRERVGFTVSLALLDGRDIVYGARAYSHRKGQYQADEGRRVGSRVPASCTAMGKALLAGLPDEDSKEWIELTELTLSAENSIVRKSLFTSELEWVRRQGFAINNQELVSSMVALAAEVPRRATVSVAVGIAANAGVISATALANKCGNDLFATVSDLAEHLVGHTSRNGNN
jgi:DNA-binding IclR family transcriptional regulator